jgi:hypothetical protein
MASLLIGSLSDRIAAWWFTPAPARRLALLRLVVGLYALTYMGGRFNLHAAIAATNPSLFDPVGVVSWLRAPLPVDVQRTIMLLTLAFNVLFLLGWKHRITGPLFAGLLLWSLSYRNSWTMVFHSDNLLVLHVLILGLTPAADALSVDAWKRKTRRRWYGSLLGVRRRRSPDGDWEYGYPLRLMCGVTAAAYFLAGFAKVAGPLSWGWAAGDSMRLQLAADALRKDLLAGGAPAMPFLLYQHIWLWTFVGVLTLVVELGAPLVLLNRRLSQIWALMALGMHWMIEVIMDITFEYQLSFVPFLAYFPIERPFDWLIGRGQALWNRIRPAKTANTMLGALEPAPAGKSANGGAAPAARRGRGRNGGRGQSRQRVRGGATS